VANGSRDVEREANTFASAFLINRSDLTGAVRHVANLPVCVLFRRLWELRLCRCLGTTFLKQEVKDGKQDSL
jgi:hypothetical protein